MVLRSTPNSMPRDQSWNRTQASYIQNIHPLFELSPLPHLRINIPRVLSKNMQYSSKNSITQGFINVSSISLCLHPVMGVKHLYEVSPVMYSSRTFPFSCMSCFYIDSCHNSSHSLCSPRRAPLAWVQRCLLLPSFLGEMNTKRYTIWFLSPLFILVLEKVLALRGLADLGHLVNSN